MLPPPASSEFAYPIGNGLPGATVYVGIERERRAINEETLQAEGPRKVANPRMLVISASKPETEDQGAASMHCVPAGAMLFLVIVDSWIETDNAGASGYSWEVDIDAAFVTILRDKLITLDESGKLMQRYEDALNSYTYLATGE